MLESFLSLTDLCNVHIVVVMEVCVKIKWKPTHLLMFRIEILYLFNANISVYDVNASYIL